MNELVYFYPEGHEAHFEPGHPERPERVEAIVDALEQAGWWQKFPHLTAIDIPFLCSTLFIPRDICQRLDKCAREELITMAIPTRLNLPGVWLT
jgi:acetoin utilization deacetylase AcuC-like enzyme